MKMDTPAWTSLVNSAKYSGMYFAPSTNLHLSPGTLFNVSRPLNPNDNNENFKDDRYTQLVADAGSTTDPTKLKDVYAQLNDTLLDESFAIYLSPNLTTMLARQNVRDVLPNMHAGWTYTTAWMDA
jgi:ABC-type transport system substrate-binding protein